MSDDKVTHLPPSKSGGGVADWAAKLKPLCAAVVDATKAIQDAAKAREDASKLVVPQAITAGAELAKAKAEVGHGNWLPLLKTLGLKDRTATRWIKIANGKAGIDKWLADKSATMADLTLVKAERIALGKDDGGDDGLLSKYQKAHKSLMDKLQAMLPEDAAVAAQATIEELQKVISRPMTKAAAA